MPFHASQRHQYWTVDVRYLDMRQLGGGMIYVISILENYSRCILASMLSRSQDLQPPLLPHPFGSRQVPSPASRALIAASVRSATCSLLRMLLT
jgi:hypothetical protein